MTSRIPGDDERMVDAEGDPLGPLDLKFRAVPKRFELKHGSRKAAGARKWERRYRERLRQAEEDAS